MHCELINERFSLSLIIHNALEHFMFDKNM
jgi:hypothetical protein